MDRVLAEFITALRGADVRVSTAESIDASRVVQHLGFQDRAQLKHGLSLTLAKSQPEKDAFDLCFERFFQFESAESSDDTRSPDTPDQTQSDRAESEAALPASPSDPQSNPLLQQTNLGQMLLSGNQSGVDAAMAAAAQQVDLTRMRVMTQKGLFSRRIQMAMGLEDLENTLWQAEESNRPADRQLATALRQARDRLRRQVKDHVERQFVLLASEQGKRLREATLMQAKLENLRDYAAVQALVRKLAKKLVAMHSRRRKLYRRGHLDIRNTLRHSAAYNGIPFRVHWKSKRIERPKLVVICDISGSVSQVSRFLLMFLYSLTDILPKVKAFVFSSRLGDVSDTFTSTNLDSAIHYAMQTYGSGSTNYGAALEDFHDQAFNALDHRTTVLILGDARNNYGDPRTDLLQLIAARSQQLIWLNPEERNRWGSGDSEMLRYLPFCSVAEVCNSLQHLERIIHRVLQRSR